MPCTDVPQLYGAPDVKMIIKPERTTTALRPEPISRRLWFMFRVGFALLALWVAVTERWDTNGNGEISPHEALLFGVRFLAFPLHVVLSLTPTAVLHWLGLPDAYWPASAFAAVLISLPLWGILAIGGILTEAWLEGITNARRARKSS